MEETETRFIKMTVAAEGIFLKKEKFVRLAEGFGFSEGPVWDRKQRCLYFTDFPNDKIYKWTEEEGTAVYTASSNRAIGLSLDSEGNLISCESGKRRIAVVNERGSRGLAQEYQCRHFNSPNDVIVAENGDIYFTDPLSLALGLPSEQGFCGVYKVMPGGRAEVVEKEMRRPNGLALSKDESVLYVNDTGENTVYVYTKNEKGDFTGKRVFAVLDGSYGEGAADGMKVDRFQNVWVTGPGGIWIFNQTGECICILKCPEFVGNFCFGGEEGDELFLTASTSLYRMKLTERMV